MDETESHRHQGVRITIFWPDLTTLIQGLGLPDFYNEQSYADFGLYDLMAGYAMFNPHATFELQGIYIESNGEAGSMEWSSEATDPEWKKWKPGNPTSAHWYDGPRLGELIAAYLNAERYNGRTKSVREFISEFRGLSGTAKQRLVLEECGLKGKNLTDLVTNGNVDPELVNGLLEAMRSQSKPVRAMGLGTIGKEHISRQMVEGFDVQPETIRYKKIAGNHGDRDLPHLLEVAFGVYSDESDSKKRKIVTGLNWAPTLGTPVREFDQALGEMRVDRYDPVCMVMHIARPSFDFVDRGKGRLDV